MRWASGIPQRGVYARVGEVLAVIEIAADCDQAPVHILARTGSDSRLIARRLSIHHARESSDLPGPAQALYAESTHSPRSADTAAPFGSNALESIDIQKFTNEFLTSPDFFPDYGEAVAPSFSQNGEQVRQAARELHAALAEIIPADGEEGEDWATVPFLWLQLTYAEVDGIRELDNAEGSRSVQEAARVSEIDGEAKRNAAINSTSTSASSRQTRRARSRSVCERASGWAKLIAVSDHLS